MKPKLVTYKCIRRTSDKCWKEWEINTTDDPPYYKECDPCYEQMCADERELTSDCD